MQLKGDTQTVLVAEDEAEMRSYLGMALRCQGYGVEFAEDGEEVISMLQNEGHQISLALLDVMMPNKDGLETLKVIRGLDAELPVIMLSGASSVFNVVEAMKAGANDFLAKPVSHEDLGKAIRKALKIRAKVVNEEPEAASPAVPPEALLELPDRQVNIEAFIQRVGASDVPVLIQGETGAGKEVLARQLHSHSPRSNKPFVKINCAALPSELVESELFGYERGAFTGAFKGKAGLFEMAEGGTILLDEIGDMDHKLQAKLLQVLQDYQFRRLGGTDPVTVDVRVIAATHCELEKLVQENRFREDLYYRLNIVKIHVPPLRERTEEIMPLAEYFLKKFATPGAPQLEISQSLRQALLEHNWPGNVRELENIVRRLLVFQDCELVASELRVRSMRKDTVAAPAQPDPHLQAPEKQPATVLAKVNEARRQAEIKAILAVLNATRWNRKQAAARLNIDYKALLYKMKKLGIEGQPAESVNGQSH